MVSTFSPSSGLPLFATAPRGLEALLAEELRILGAGQVREARAGVAFAGGLEAAYRTCLWSRLASRVLINLRSFQASNPEVLYSRVREMAWEDHLDPEGTLAVDAVVSNSAISHSHYAALRVKDAVVDRFRDRFGNRPSVDLARPSVRLNLRIDRDRAVLSLDLSGESLHRRGYRLEGAFAPLKENLAAAILQFAGWPELAASGAPLVDPLCGSGTLVLEAALIAADLAPGLLRDHFGFLGWRGHDPRLWSDLRKEAVDRRRPLTAGRSRLLGLDHHPEAIAACFENARRAGIEEWVEFRQGKLADLVPPPAGESGLLVTNPPYGERLGTERELVGLYRTLGEKIGGEFGSWRSAVFTGSPELTRSLGCRPDDSRLLYNGRLPCRLLTFEPGSVRQPAAPALPADADMFANRIRKNLRRLGRWAKREGVTCFRLYDADVPEYALAVDWYEGWVHVQEYEAPPGVDPVLADARAAAALGLLPELLQVAPERIHFKMRRRQRGEGQYRKRAEEGKLHEVREGSARLLVNFTDYLDTGLFLDHRPTRRLIQEWAAGKSFLNLFAYTGSATVCAALGGAGDSVSVDLSRRYLDWARRNLDLNGIDPVRHRLIRAECLEWLRGCRQAFDLIFLDPPTFSRSRGVEGTLEIQRDHGELIGLASRLLAPRGRLVFSTNYRRFDLDLGAVADSGLRAEEITERTLDPDFRRQPAIHRCWLLERSGKGSALA